MDNIKVEFTINDGHPVLIVNPENGTPLRDPINTLEVSFTKVEDETV